jgi:ParB-like nuclease domain
MSSRRARRPKYRIDHSKPLRPIDLEVEDEFLHVRRDGLEHSHVGKLIDSYANGESVPPMRAARLNAGKYYLIDGYHRYAALEYLQRLDRPIVIEVCQVRNKDEARREAINSNSRPPLALDPATKEEEVDRIVAQELYLKPDGTPMSGRAMAETYMLYSKTHWPRILAKRGITLFKPPHKLFNPEGDYVEEEEEEYTPTPTKAADNVALASALEAIRLAGEAVATLANQSDIQKAIAAIGAVQSKLPTDRAL